MTKVQLIWFDLYTVLWERECRSHQVRHVGIMEIARDDNLGSITCMFNSAGSRTKICAYTWGKTKRNGFHCCNTGRACKVYQTMAE